MPTQGSCRPLTEIVVFFPNLSIVFLVVKIDEVGLTANETIILVPLKYHQEFHQHYWNQILIFTFL